LRNWIKQEKAERGERPGGLSRTSARSSTGGVTRTRSEIVAASFLAAIGDARRF
jgi:hypothetical protein